MLALAPPAKRTRLCLGQNREIGPGLPTLVVAELGQNHNGRLDTALALVDAAAWAGADAVKVVKRDLDCELTAAAWRAPYDSPHAFGATYGEHRAALELRPQDHQAIARRARRWGLLYFGTACDAPSVRLLERLEVDAFKIASRDLANEPLLRDVAGRGRPVILSTGMSNWPEIDAAVETVRAIQSDYALLHCTSLYPTPDDDAHLRCLPVMARRYDAPTGYSDHTRGGLLAPVAVALGACLIEKHLTLDRAAKGTDHACSLEPEEFRRLTADVRRVEAALGLAEKTPPEAVRSVKARLGRSLVTRVALAAGQEIAEPLLALKCAGEGLAWRDLPGIVGRRLTRDLAADEKLTAADLA